VRQFEGLPKVAFRLGLRADLQCQLAPYAERLRQTPAFLRLLDTRKRFVDGQERRLPRADVADIQPGAVSLMPAGFAEQLSRQELADLLAFLKGTRWGA